MPTISERQLFIQEIPLVVNDLEQISRIALDCDMDEMSSDSSQSPAASMAIESDLLGFQAPCINLPRATWTPKTHHLFSSTSGCHIFLLCWQLRWQRKTS